GQARSCREVRTGGTLSWTGCDQFGNQGPVAPVIPRLRKEPFDAPAWTFEPKLDGFRGIADTIGGRMLSKKSESVQPVRSPLGQAPGRRGARRRNRGPWWKKGA